MKRFLLFRLICIVIMGAYSCIPHARFNKPAGVPRQYINYTPKSLKHRVCSSRAHSHTWRIHPPDVNADVQPPLSFQQAMQAGNRIFSLPYNVKELLVSKLWREDLTASHRAFEDSRQMASLLESRRGQEWDETFHAPPPHRE